MIVLENEPSMVKPLIKVIGIGGAGMMMMQNNGNNNAPKQKYGGNVKTLSKFIKK